MRILFLITLCLAFASCSLFDGEERDEFAGLDTEEQFYVTAQRQLNARNYRSAIATYEALESRFPFGRFAAQGQLELIYAYYSNLDLEAARTAADRFIRLHPDNPNIDYAYYMKGMASFAEDSGFMARFCRLTLRNEILAARGTHLPNSHCCWLFIRTVTMQRMPVPA